MSHKAFFNLKMFRNFLFFSYQNYLWMLSLWKTLYTPFHKDEYNPKVNEGSHKARLATFFKHTHLLTDLITYVEY